MKTNSLFDDFDFPEISEKRYLSAPVYLEPMRGSGESLVVAGVVQGNGELSVKSLISSRVAENLYGKKGRSFISLVNMVISQLEKELNDSTQSLDEFLPKIDGAKLGVVRTTYADTPHDALKQVAMLHASLCDKSTLNELSHGNKEWVLLPQNENLTSHFYNELKPLLTVCVPVTIYGVIKRDVTKREIIKEKLDNNSLWSKTQTLSSESISQLFLEFDPFKKPRYCHNEKN